MKDKTRPSTLGQLLRDQLADAPHPMMQESRFVFSRPQREKLPARTMPKVEAIMLFRSATGEMLLYSKHNLEMNLGDKPEYSVVEVGALIRAWWEQH